jgi:capsular polysaccharide transport system permease protein
MKRWLERHAVFLATVALPTLVALVYFGLIASDVYISESRFVVRNGQQSMPSTSLVGELLLGTGLTHSQDDTYLVHDYMTSRDALHELDERVAIRKHYANRDLDVFSRFPGWDWDSSFENFHRYYQRRVSVDLDPVTSISVLMVRAYSAEEAQRINGELLEMSERLVNTVNDRSRADLVKYAEHDVEAAAQKAKDATLALYKYRSANWVYEPNKQAEIEFQAVMKLQQELVDTQVQLADLTRLSPSNPQIGALKGHIEALRVALAGESAKLTEGSASFGGHASRMDRLLVDLEFADKYLGATLAALESARNQALHQELYVDILVAPNLPDYPLEPRRVRTILTVFLVGLVLWGVVSLVLASVREHMD